MSPGASSDFLDHAHCGVGRTRGSSVFKRLLVFLAIATVVLAFDALFVTTAIAASPPGPYFNGFETDTAGWFNLSGATITRRPSGYTTGVGGYASGISSADGSYHARLGKDTSPDSCTFGGGTASIFYGPYTKWGGYSSIFPTAGYKTRVDIYLDVPWAQAHPDTRFDWSSAISDASGGFRRDFVFNVGTDALGFVMTGGNNATRCGANPSDPGHAPVAHVTTSGWYTFEHHFTGVVGGPLVVNLSVIEKTSNVVVGTWTRADPTDIIGVTVGGNRYGWFVQNEIDQLAIDNSERTGLVSTIGCEVMINDGGWITAVNMDKASFGGNAKVAASGDTTGQQEYQDHGPIQPVNIKAVTVEVVLCDKSAGTAELYGQASVDGSDQTYEYQIKLKDAGQGNDPGDKYGIIVPGIGYASGDRNLEGGNVNIRFP